MLIFLCPCYPVRGLCWQGASMCEFGVCVSPLCPWDLLGFKGSSKSYLSVILNLIQSEGLRMSIWCNTSGSTISSHVTEWLELTLLSNSLLFEYSVDLCVGSAGKVADSLAHHISFVESFYGVFKWIFVFIKWVVGRPQHLRFLFLCPFILGVVGDMWGFSMHTRWLGWTPFDFARQIRISMTTGLPTWRCVCSWWRARLDLGCGLIKEYRVYKGTLWLWSWIMLKYPQ